LKQLHSAAYNWNAPDVIWPEVGQATPMRTYVRAWINAWDVRRIYNVRADEDGFVIDAVKSDYGEVRDLSTRDSDDDQGRDDANGGAGVTSVLGRPPRAASDVGPGPLATGQANTLPLDDDGRNSEA